jgi:hypothetical protein
MDSTEPLVEYLQVRRFADIYDNLIEIRNNIHSLREDTGIFLSKYALKKFVELAKPGCLYSHEYDLMGLFN